MVGFWVWLLGGARFAPPPPPLPPPDPLVAAWRGVVDAAVARQRAMQQLAQNMPGGGMAGAGLLGGTTTAVPFGPSPDAKNRARALLSRLLSPGQRRQWASHGSFIERGTDGHSYVLSYQGMFQIDDETGERREYLCTAPALEPGSPPEDAIIARLLHLRSDANGLRRKANASRLA